MRRLLPLLLLFSLACAFLAPRPTPTALPTPGETDETPIRPDTPSPEAVTATLSPSATALPTVAPSPTATAGYHLGPEDVTFHPGPPLYSGDIVSLEIDATRADPAWQEALVNLRAGSGENRPLATVRFGRFGIGERAQATFIWAWDTQGLEGPQTLVVTVDRTEGPAVAPLDAAVGVTLTVNLLPADQRPLPEPLARWAESRTACCVFHYLTHTAAARDLAQIEAEAEAAMARVEGALGVARRAKISFTLLSRLLGHGGFAREDISMTYIDRNPAGNNLSTVFAHEMTHILDQQLAGRRPALVAEGLAVYMAGGHFKPEDLEQRAAALLALGRYIPLAELAEDFYPAQHEIGYLEAGAFVKYLVDTYGWERFETFYGSFEDNPSHKQMLDQALRANFYRRLDELEADWLAHLRSLVTAPAPAQVADLRLTIALYATLRRYQQADDPSAYFLTAWLPDGVEARRRGITADFLRRPTAPENIALEAMLADAQRALGAGDFDAVETRLASVNAVLDANNLFADPLAADYLQIVTNFSAQGYEVQSITLDEQTARVTAIRAWPELETFTLDRAATGWRTVYNHQ